MTLNKDKIEKWREWLKRIKNDIMWTLSEAEVYEEFVRINNENLDHINKHHGGTWCNSIWTWHAFFSGFAIRRQVDSSSDRNNRSLRNFLEDFKNAASEFDYDFYLTLFPVDPTASDCWQKNTFGKFSENGKTISLKIIQSDIDELEKIRVVVAGHLDRVWAHLDKRGVGKSPQNESLTSGFRSDAIVTIDRIACKYIALLTSEGHSSLKPERAYPWTDIFKVPFIAPTKIDGEE